MKASRDEGVRSGRKLISSRFTTGFGKNLSIVNREKGLIAISPGGIEYFNMQPEDVVLFDADDKGEKGTCAPQECVST